MPRTSYLSFICIAQQQAEDDRADAIATNIHRKAAVIACGAATSAIAAPAQHAGHQTDLRAAV